MKQKKFLCLFFSLLLLGGAAPAASAAPMDENTGLAESTIETDLGAASEPASESTAEPEPPVLVDPDGTTDAEDHTVPEEDAGSSELPPTFSDSLTPPNENIPFDETFFPEDAEQWADDGLTEDDGLEGDGEQDEDDELALDDELDPSEEPEDEMQPDIFITVPSTGSVVVNPYRLNVSVENGETNEQVVSAAMPVINYSSVPVGIAVSAIGTVPAGSTATFVNVPPALDTSGKEVFVYMEFQPSFDGEPPVSWEDHFYDAPNQLLIADHETAKDDVLILNAGDESPAYGMFRLFGAASGAPDEMWTTEDTIDIFLTFTFRPLEPDPAGFFVDENL